MYIKIVAFDELGRTIFVSSFSTVNAAEILSLFAPLMILDDEAHVAFSSTLRKYLTTTSTTRDSRVYCVFFGFDAT